MSETSERSSENDKCKRPRGSRKRQVHNEVERRRKDKINAWITKIGELLPCTELHKQSKISILEQTVDYIKLLASERDKLLSENCSEVQVEEIKKLKRDLKFLSEQNILYEKLLAQSKISLKPLPKKELKYSNRFAQKNGIVTVQKTETKIRARIDKSIQVNMCLNIPSTNSVSHSSPSTKEVTKSPSSGTAKICKPSTKPTSGVLKPAKILSATTSSTIIKSCVPVSCIQSSSVVSSSFVTKTVQPSSSVSDESIIPIINCYDPARNPTSFHAGGVTTVLSQFPVMSTNHGSSFSNVCNKNVPTFIIPSGGLMQQFVTEKSSNTISVICPSTLPILVPQQVFSMPSMARNVGLQPAIICPGPVDSSSTQVEKSALGGTLLTINSNSVVPMSSSFPVNTQIILPSQPAVLGNTCSSVNLTQNVVITAASQAQSDDSTVPLIHKQPVSSPSKNNETIVNISDNATKIITAKVNKKETKTIEDALKLSKDMPTLQASQSTSKETGHSVRMSSQIKTKKLSRDLRNLCMNLLHSPPSLQVLSANKIISLANQSQRVRTNIPLTFDKKTVDKSIPGSFLVTNSKPNNLSLQKVGPELSKSELAEESETVESIKQKASVSSECLQTSDSTTAKSNFSLTVLIGDSLNVNQNCKNTNSDKKSTPTHENRSNLEIAVTTSNTVSFVTSIPLESSVFSNTCESIAVSSGIRQNGFNSSVQISEFSNASIPRINSENEKMTVSNTKRTDSQSISQKFIPNTTSNLSVLISSNEMNRDTSNFSNANASMNIDTTSYNLDMHKLNIKQNLPSLNISSKSIQSLKTVTTVQNNQNQPHMCSEHSDNSLYNGNMPYTVNESSINQTFLPSLFPSNQIMGLNSSILVCHTGHDSTGGILLPSSIQISNDIQNQPCLLQDSNSDFQTFSVVNKDLILQNSAATNVTAAHVPIKKVPETVSSFSTHSSVSSANNTNMGDDSEKNDEELATCENDGSKSFVASKKKIKSTVKECKTSVTDKAITNSQTPSDVPNNSISDRNQADSATSLPKSDSSSCSRQESNNFIFTSDILARATESIFGNDMLESPQMPKRNDNCYSDESSNMNVPLSTAEKAVDSNYKLQYSCIREDHTVPEASPGKSKKNAADDLQHLNLTHSHNLQNNENHAQELNLKLNKPCKARKSKTVADCEPPSKKMKETLHSPEKTSNVLTFNPHQMDKNDKNLSAAHSNLSFLDKHVSSPAHTSAEDQNVSIGNFQNQIHLSDNSCKTPSSVDAIFSLTPMLGDILKDVSHNVNLDTRGTNFLMANENQTIFSTEKNLISFNYSNNSNEDYLNLPRMYFPIIPEVSSAPVVHVTNVSFAHSVSLCSTQSDSQKSTETHPSSDSQNKCNSKKKDVPLLFHSNHNILSLDLDSGNMSKQSECVLKTNNSEPHFNIAPPKVSNNNSVLFDSQHSDVQSQNLTTVPSNLVVSQPVSQYSSRDNFMPSVSHTLSFYPTISSSSSIQNFPCTTSSLPHVSYNNNSSSAGTVPVSFQTSGNTNNSFNAHSVLSKPDGNSFDTHSVLSKPENNSFNTHISLSKSENNSFNTHPGLSKPESNSFNTHPGLSKPESNSFNNHLSLSKSESNTFNTHPALSKPESNSFNTHPALSKPESNSFNTHPALSKPESNFNTHPALTKPDSNSFINHAALSKPESLSHSLCSLLKENANVENRGGSNETSSHNTPSSNVTQSKYSALSLISDQTSYSESVSVTTSIPQFVQTSAVYTTSASEGQYISTVSSCGRNPKTSLSYSAESLLQTSCANSDKTKNKNSNRYTVRTAEKKTDRNSIANIHSMSETNIFMPVTSCDINIQNAPLVPLPPVTSFHNFSSNYTMCETVPSTTMFNSVTRTQDAPLSLSNDNFLNHMNLNVDSQMLNNRHEVSSTVPKHHSNIPLPFENHNTIYNNCNFLPHVKPTLEGSRSSEASACFQSSYSNNYSQQNQKPNCCHFSHRAIATNTDLSNDINLPVAVTVASFHTDKNNFQTNRPGLQTSFSQSNTNFMGNFFYNTSTNCRDGNDMNIKPSTVRTSQEMYVPEGVRQNIHDQNAGVVFNNRKTTVPSNRTKSKKPKNASSNENSNAMSTCITNYSTPQDTSCNKSNISYVPNGYFKSSAHPVLPPPGPLQCSQNKMPDAVIPPNPSFNPVLHQQGDNFLNLNFQHPNFTMSPLPRPPTQPLSSSCLTTPIISHTFSSSTPHPVPNFNLSNILPDMGCSGNQVSFSPAKFPMNHSLSASSAQCQTNPSITNSAHIVSHQSCAPSLYPPHPPMVRGTLNPILGHNSQSLIDNQVSLVGTAGAVMSQNTTFAATQNPPFRNVMHSITFPRNDR